MLSAYRGNSLASSPQASNKPILVSGGFSPDAPVSIVFAQSPYTITDISTVDIRTFLVSTAGGAVTINLPAIPVNGEIVTVKRTTTDGNTLTVGRNGKNIEGAAANFADANATLTYYTFQYDSTSGSWWVIS